MIDEILINHLLKQVILKKVCGIYVKNMQNLL